MNEAGGMGVSRECVVEGGEWGRGCSQESRPPPTPSPPGCPRLLLVLGAGEPAGQGKALCPFQKENSERVKVEGRGDGGHGTQPSDPAGRFSEGHDLELEPEGGVDLRQVKGDRKRVLGLGRGGNRFSVGRVAGGGAAQTTRGLVPARGAAGAGRMSRYSTLEPSRPFSALRHGEPANRKCKCLSTRQDPAALRVKAELLAMALAGPQAFTRWAGEFRLEALEQEDLSSSLRCSTFY